MIPYAYDGAEFWTLERIAKSQAMRDYSRQWAACSELEQWRLRGYVHQLRGQGLSEKEIGRSIETMLNHMRPWRMTDAQLGRALRKGRVAAHAWRNSSRMRRRC